MNENNKYGLVGLSIFTYECLGVPTVLFTNDLIVFELLELNVSINQILPK